MTLSRGLVIGIALAVPTPRSLYAQSQPAARQGALRVTEVSRAMRIDGRLIEPDWSTVDSIGDLTQVEPLVGTRPSARTVVRVLTTQDALIIGVRADDPEPSRIVSFARQRDAILDSEDHIKIVLDTYR